MWRQTPGPPPHTGPSGDLIQAHAAFYKTFSRRTKLLFKDKPNYVHCTVTLSRKIYRVICLGSWSQRPKKAEGCAKNLFLCPIILGLQSRRSIRACCCLSSCVLSVVSPRPLVGVDTPGLGAPGGWRHQTENMQTISTSAIITCQEEQKKCEH